MKTVKDILILISSRFSVHAVGIISQVIIAAKFGASYAMDAYLVAMGIPQFSTRVLVGGLQKMFIPVFFSERQLSNDSAQQFVNKIITLFSLILLFIAILSFFFSSVLISAVAPGLDRQTSMLGSNILKTIASMIFSLGLQGLITSLHHCYGKFALPAIVPMFGSAIIILSLMIFADKIGIYALAIGNTLSGLFVVLILLRKIRHRVKIDLKVLHRSVAKGLKLLWPLLLASSFYKSTMVIDRMIASFLPTSSISYLEYANKLNKMVLIISSAISTVFFPKISQIAYHDDYKEFKELLLTYFVLVAMVVIPIAVFLFVSGQLLIQILFERGRFDQNASICTFRALRFYTGYLIGVALGGITANALYSLQKSKAAAAIGIFGASTNIILDIVLVRRLSYSGIALASSCAVVPNVFLHLSVLRRRIGCLRGKELLTSLLKIIACSIIMGLVLFALPRFHVIDIRILDRILNLGFSVAVAAIAYISLLYLMRVSEFKSLVARRGRIALGQE